MLRFSLVKDTALLPLRYVLFVLVLVLLVGGMQVLHAVGRFELASGDVLAWIIADALFVAVPISSIVAAAATLFTVLLRPGQRVIKLLGLFISCAAVLVVGTMATTTYAHQTTPQEQPLPPFSSERLYRTDSAGVYGESVQGAQIQRVLSFSRSAEPRFSLHQSAVIDPFQRTVRVPEADVTLPYSDMRLTTPGIVRAPSGVDGLLSDIRRLSVTLAVAAAPSLGTDAALPATRAIRPPAAAAGTSALLPLIVLCSALSFALVGAWNVVRMTRWPLFNALLIAAILRLLLLLVRAAGDPMLVEAAGRFTTMVPEGYLLAAALVAAGLLMMLLRLALPSFSMWQREMTYG